MLPSTNEAGNERAIAAAARRHGFGIGAAQALAEALQRSGGAMAQFSHPELGGMGQYTRGGMLMIGDMFNDVLKGRVRALADDLATALDFAPDASSPPHETAGTGGARWWPENLGEPSSSGAQNGMRYAVFPARQRLVVEREGRVTVHDTGNHRITGASQQQGGTSSLRFSDAHGTVELEALPTVR